MEMKTILFAFSLTIFAGLATGIGSLIGFFSKQFNPKSLAGALGFYAGVLLTFDYGFHFNALFTALYLLPIEPWITKRANSQLPKPPGSSKP